MSRLAKSCCPGPEPIQNRKVKWPWKFVLMIYKKIHKMKKNFCKKMQKKIKICVNWVISSKLFFDVKFLWRKANFFADFSYFTNFLCVICLIFFSWNNGIFRVKMDKFKRFTFQVGSFIFCLILTKKQRRGQDALFRSSRLARLGLGISMSFDPLAYLR